MRYSRKLSAKHPVLRFWDRGSTWPAMRRKATRELLGELKVSKYNGTIGGNKDIPWLEVTIDNTRGMQALDALNNFGIIEAGSIMPVASLPCPRASVCCLSDRVSLKLPTLASLSP